MKVKLGIRRNWSSQPRRVGPDCKRKKVCVPAVGNDTSGVRKSCVKTCTVCIVLFEGKKRRKVIANRAHFSYERDIRGSLTYVVLLLDIGETARHSVIDGLVTCLQDVPTHNPYEAHISLYNTAHLILVHAGGVYVVHNSEYHM
jgi:hypothetical protein